MGEAFWQTKSLQELSAKEWESLCDGCGRCCVQKLQDDESEEIHYTNLSCDLLNTKTCRCTDYPNRLAKVSDCVQLSIDNLDAFGWLPTTCAYRLVAEGKPLFEWHPLISGNGQSVIDAGISVKNRVIPESAIPEEDWEEHIITWIEC